jgi:flavorubredoxin
METTTTTEIAPGIFRLSTYVEQVAPPAGFTFNQFVVRGHDPFLFHTGMRQLFPLVSAAVDDLVGLDALRWISFGHVEADECGAVNQFLAAAPKAEVTHGGLACAISLDDLCDRPPVPADGVGIDVGGHVLRFIATPHVPHNWESGLWFDESTRTLFAGDLFTSLGNGPAVVETDLVEGALVAEDVFHASSISAEIPATIRRLADLEPEVIACMHGSSFRGDGGAQLRALADAYDVLVAAPV